MDNQHIGKAEVLNCKFEYECPLDWFKLATTNDPKVRHCGVCKKPVTFCEDLAEMVALERTTPGACVALHARKITYIDASIIRMGLPRRSPHPANWFWNNGEGEEK